MEHFIALFAFLSLMTFIALVILSWYEVALWHRPTAGSTRLRLPQKEWDEDQLLVVNMLELGEYQKDDTLNISTQRTADGKSLVFSLTIWWPVFNGINTQKVTVWNVKRAGSYVMIGGTIEL